MGWLGSVGAIAELVLQIISVFKKHEVQQLGVNLKNAKSVEEKQAIARAVAEHLYSK